MTATAKRRSAESAPLPSRREFLSYALIASVGLTAAASCGGLVWFLQQPTKYGVETRIFLIDLKKLPAPDDSPILVIDAHSWLANISGGLVAYAVCPFCMCVPNWSESNLRFECTCCGSKYQLDGICIDGPSKRGLDRLVLTVTTYHGTFKTPANGAPISIEGAKQIVLNANDSQLILGKPRPPRLNS